mgnify:CR=1 FL=1
MLRGKNTLEASLNIISPISVCEMPYWGYANRKKPTLWNIIYNELRRRGCKVDVGMVEQRFVDNDGKWQRKQLEVDFVVNEGNQRYYIQSALALPDEEKRKQEMGSLLRINDSFKKIIIVKDDIKPWRDENGILTMGLLDFLMNADSLEL